MATKSTGNGSKGNGSAPKKTTKKKAAPKSPTVEAFYAALGMITLESKDVEKAYKYLIKKGKPRGVELEKEFEGASKKARKTIIDLRDQVSESAEDLSEKVGGYIDDIKIRVRIEQKDQPTVN